MTSFSPGGPRYSAARLFLVAAVFIAAAPVFWHRTQTLPAAIPAAYENADLYQGIYPALHYGFGRLRAGEVPLWNASQLCGAPFLANPEAGLFQPLNLVFAVLPTEKALAVHGFLCLAIMGAGFVLFARSLGVGYLAACVGGTAYAFCGASAAAITRPALASMLAWLPLLFWALREGSREFRLAGAIPAGIIGALIVFSGAHALALIVLSLAALYALMLAIAPGQGAPSPVRHRLEWLACAFLAGVLVAAIQWIPACAWALSMEQPWDALFHLDAVGQCPGSFSELLAQLLVPKPGAVPRVAYLSLLALLSVPAALFHRGARREACFFAVAALLLMALSIEIPERVSLVFSAAICALPAMFCLAVLAALGLDRLLVAPRAPHAPRVWAPALSVLICAAVLFYVSTAEPQGRIIVFVLILLPAVLFRLRPMSAICALALLALLFADLLTAHTNAYRHPFLDAPSCFQRYAKTIRAAEEQSLGGRVLASAPVLDFALPANLGMLFPGVSDAGGQGPLTRDQAVWWRQLRPEAGSDSEAPQVFSGAAMPNLLNFMAVRAIMAAPDGLLHAGAWSQGGPRLREVTTEDNVRLFVNEDALSRAFWTPSWRAAEGVAHAMEMINEPGFEPARECVLDRDRTIRAATVRERSEIAPGPRRTDEPLPPLPETVACSLEDVDAERVVVRVHAPQPGITVLADTFAPGWKATLDGTPCSISRANGLFRGVATPAGEHIIVFEYRPLPVIVGLIVSLTAVGLLTLCGVVAFIRG